MTDRPPPPERSPSFHDLFDEISAHHRPDSDPPFTRAFDRHVGRFVRLGARWVITTKGGTVLVAAGSYVAGHTRLLPWIAQHLTKWIGP